MGDAYGFLEISGVTAAITALDIMCKTSGVALVTWERRLGGRLVTVIIRGGVAAVSEAINAASANGIKKPAAVGVLANPHPEIVRLVTKSAGKFFNKTRRKKNVTGSVGND